MVFNSLTFLVFLFAIVSLTRMPLAWRTRKGILLVGSYLFYAAWNPPFVLLLWLSTIVDWVVAKRMAAAEAPRVRRALLVVSLAVNLGLLGFFKYGDFLLEQFVLLAEAFGVHYRPPGLGIVLPVGISFYTFQTLSYTLDVYRRDLEPSPSLLDFALFVTFFPQLVAGPIVRAREFLPQCRSPRRATADQLGWGLALLTLGLFQKTVLADGLLAPVADQVYAEAGRAAFASAWIGTLAFSGQIFFDFAGYSTCAIGVAMCVGFALPDNFRSPYAAIGFSDFWRRWHVSLSGWLRDYLYVSLGGNRRGATRTQVNLMVTMLLGGLWHGASWQFVVWGGLHGLYLVGERWVRRLRGGPKPVEIGLRHFPLALGTYALVCVTWVFFRADDFGAALHLVSVMLGASGGDLLVRRLDAVPVLLVTAGLLGTHWLLRNTSLEDLVRPVPVWGRAAALATLMAALLINPGVDRGYIYFQF